MWEILSAPLSVHSSTAARGSIQSLGFVPVHLKPARRGDARTGRLQILLFIVLAGSMAEQQAFPRRVSTRRGFCRYTGWSVERSFGTVVETPHVSIRQQRSDFCRDVLLPPLA